jgi:hypothetical protein
MKPLDATRPSVRRAATEREAWIERELAKAGPLTQEQQRDLRRVLLPPSPIARPA